MVSTQNSCDVMYGVPQGSVLGPKMFSIYVRSQPKVSSKCLLKSSFADEAICMKTFLTLLQYNVRMKLPDCMKQNCCCLQILYVWLVQSFS